ncbi:MAG: ABC transporter ATP-binding protein [Bacteroidales bacterium]|nr:ABC transporter ATP-binding protein [Bacteroidales bacterium]MDE6084538.1 ABC transporter ATP-binding protein [Muribaculaceae bacterium]
MLSVENVSKKYGSLTVLNDVSLTIGRQEIVAVIGPSGAGKTTLLQIAGTLDIPDSGCVRLDGQDLSRLNDRRLSEVRNERFGFIFQFHQLLPEFTACENVAMPALIGGKSKKAAMQEARRLLEMLGLGNRLDHKPSEMSGGERQRTAIARALINNPEIIFADEPTGSLDSTNRDEIQSILIRLRDEFHHSVVMVTHDSSLASIADRVIELADGRIVAENEKVASNSGEVTVEVTDETDLATS